MAGCKHAGRVHQLVIRAVSRRNFSWLVACSSLTAMVMVSVAALHADRISWPAEAQAIAVAWLFFAAPQLIFGLLALSIAPSLRSVAAGTLIALNLALLGFLGLVWHTAPYGEDGFVSALYIPAWVIILLMSFFFAKRSAESQVRL
jgi:hypothetical protein